MSSVETVLTTPLPVSLHLPHARLPLCPKVARHSCRFSLHVVTYTHRFAQVQQCQHDVLSRPRL